MNIFVSGANSILGKCFCEKARDQGHRVIGSIRTAVAHDFLENVFDKVVHLDLDDQSSFRSIEGDIEVIVHLAAASIGSPSELFRTTALGSYHLARRAEEIGVERIVHVSAVSVYGEITEPVLDENTSIRHSTPYGVAKWAAECFIHSSQPPTKAISVRCPAILSPKWSNHVLDRLMIQIKKTPGIVTVQNPDFHFNNCIHYTTLADFLLTLATRSSYDRNNVVVGTSNPIPFKDIVDRCIDHVGSSNEIQWVNPQRTPFSISLASAIELGLAPTTTEHALKFWLSQLDDLR